MGYVKGEYMKYVFGHGRKNRPSSEEHKNRVSVAKAGVPNTKIRGERHPRWRGGVGVIRRGDKNVRPYMAWAMAVKRRDKFTCQHCASPGNIAHHKMPFGSFPDYRYDVTNGETVCHSCHIKAHRELAIFGL